MHIKQGLIPIALGTVVTTTGIALHDTIPKKCCYGIVGYGLAHIVLGTVDVIYECSSECKTKKQFNKVLHSFK